MDLTTIKKYELFDSISTGDVRAILKSFKEIKFRKNSFIFHENEPSNQIFIIEDGFVKIVSYTNKGKEPTILLLKEGDVLGILIIAEKVRPFSAVSVSDTVLLSIEKDSFLKLLTEYPQMNYNFIKLLSKRIIYLEKKLVSITHHWSYQRICSTLLLLSEKFGTRENDRTILNISLTHQELANIVGTSRETVTKQLQRLEELGVVRTGRHIVIFHDRLFDLI